MSLLLPRLTAVTLALWAAGSLAPTAASAQAIAPDASSRTSQLLRSLGAEPSRARITWPAVSTLPQAMTGLNVQPPGASPNERARAFLRQAPQLLGRLDVDRDLRLREARPAAAGTHVIFEQHHRGIPVEGRSVWVFLDHHGNVSAARITVADRPADDGIPRFEARDAERMATEQGRMGLSHPPGVSTRLVYFAGSTPWPTATPPRLAWEVHPWPAPGIPADRYLYIDAQTGGLLADEDRLTHAERGHVFPTNPVIDDWQHAEVGLPASRDTSTDRLVSPWVEAVACLDNHQLVEVSSDFGPQMVHVCSIDRAASADGNGDFLYEPDDTSPADAFAEVNAFYQAHRAVEYFAQLGVDPDEVTPFQVLVNYQGYDGNNPDNMSDPYGMLLPVTNAYFTSGSVLGENGDHPPRLQFGQGTYADIAYDADVVYHEFGHGVVSALDGPRRSALGSYGINNEGPALNEAFADYFASVFTGDSVFAEYASWRPDDEIIDGWRDLDNTRDCVHDMRASAHNDGQAWAGALWATRERLLPAQQNSFDRSLIDAIRAMGAYATFEVASTITLGLVTQNMGGDVGELLRSELNGRYLFNCARWRRYDEGPTSLSASGLRGMNVSGPAPGPLQLIVPVSRIGGDLVIRGTQRLATGTRLHLGGFTAEPNPYLRILARWDAPITYVPLAGLMMGVYDADVPVLETGLVSESATSQWYGFEARVPISAEGEVYVMLASSADQGGGLGSLKFSEEEHRDVVGGPEPAARPTLDRTHPLCSLESGASSPSPWALTLIALLGHRRRHKRCRQEGCAKR